MTKGSNNLADAIRRAMRRDGRTVYAFARDTALAVSGVQDFMTGRDLRLSSASKLCKVLGLELRPTKRKKGR
jgi:hypothetical protein